MAARSKFGGALMFLRTLGGQALDEYDRRLREAVRPVDWRNPTPSGRYNLAVIGAGTAGLVSAMGAAGLGAKVALIERDLFGGDCLNFGCVPSKALLRSARAIADTRRAAEFGVDGAGDASVNFPAAMARMRRLRASIAPNDSVLRFRNAGIDVFLGSARFVSPSELEVDGRRLSFAKAVIATGARAAQPAIPGLSQVGCLTNETVFSLGRLPRRFLVVGAGPIGCEMAQAFARFGSAVTVVASSKQALPKEETCAAAVVQSALAADGVRLILDASIRSVEQIGSDRVVHVTAAGVDHTMAADELLLAAGRRPNVEGMGLEAAGVEFDLISGIHVDDRLRTANRRIFAAGDVCSRFQFTHAADAMARVVLANALFMGRAKASALTIPRCTYTDPEAACVGLTPDEAAKQGIAIDTIEQPLEEVDRAILDGETNGFVRIHLRRGGDRIVGATIVARHAGESIAEICLAMTHRLGLRALAKTIHPYPTQSEAIKKAADAFNRTRLTPLLKKTLSAWLAWRR